MIYLGRGEWPVYATKTGLRIEAVVRLVQAVQIKMMVRRTAGARCQPNCAFCPRVRLILRGFRRSRLEAAVKHSRNCTDARVSDVRSVSPCMAGWVESSGSQQPRPQGEIRINPTTTIFSMLQLKDKPFASPRRRPWATTRLQRRRQARPPDRVRAGLPEQRRRCVPAPRRPVLLVDQRMAQTTRRRRPRRHETRRENRQTHPPNRPKSPGSHANSNERTRSCPPPKPHRESRESTRELLEQLSESTNVDGSVRSEASMHAHHELTESGVTTRDASA